MIDVHAHYLPPRYREALLAAGIEHHDGMPAIPSWSLDGALATMDALGIAVALLSVSSPGVAIGGDTVGLARHVNDVAAEVMAAHPARFGAFASLPLPDTACTSATRRSTRCWPNCTDARPWCSCTRRRRRAGTACPWADPGPCWSSRSTRPVPSRT